MIKFIKKLFLVVCIFFVFHSLDSGVVRKPKFFRILFAGDVMFDWGLRETMKRHGFYVPVIKLYNLFEEADFKIVNLETPVSESNIDIDKSKSYVFNARPEELKLLNFLNVNLVSLANNHSMDYGKKGLEETFNNLKKFNISSVGAGLNVLEANKPFNFSNAYGNFEVYAQSAIGETRLFATSNSSGAAYFTLEKLIALEKADLVNRIAFLHWGIEYRPEPTKTQITQAKSLIDAGFVAVVGHHPHIPQGVQKYKNGIIIYSLGNFIFGSRNPYLNHNLAAMLHFQNNQLVVCELIPIFGKFQKSEHIIQPLEGEEANEFLLEIAVLSEKLGTKIEIKNGRGYVYF